MLNLLDTNELAQTLHISARSLRNRLSLNPSSLPPVVRFPGLRKVLFRHEDVQSFISAHIQVQKRAGRPTKRQQLEKSQTNPQ